MPEMKVDIFRCKGCYLCIQVCPKKCIEKSAKFSKTGYYPATDSREGCCNGCLMCARICPDLAVKVYK